MTTDPHAAPVGEAPTDPPAPTAESAEAPEATAVTPVPGVIITERGQAGPLPPRGEIPYENIPATDVPES